MEYTYEEIIHQVGRDANEHVVIETMFSHALCNKLVVMVDSKGVFFTIINPENDKVLAMAYTKQVTIKEVL